MKTTDKSAALASTISAQVAAVAEFAATAPESETPPPELPNPTAGGSYLRDPVTGALSPNPAFHAPQPE